MSDNVTPHRGRTPGGNLQMLAVALLRAAEALQTAAREAEQAALVVVPGAEAIASPTDAQLLTIGEAAKALRISRSKLYAHVLSGDIPSITLGRSRRIPAAGLATWIERQQFQQS